MITVILVVHILVAVALVGVILLQRSEGGALGIGGGGGFMTGRSAANALTRTTAVLAAGFMATSILLAVMAGGAGPKNRSLIQQTPPASEQMPALPRAPTAPISQ